MRQTEVEPTRQLLNIGQRAGDLRRYQCHARSKRRILVGHIVADIGLRQAKSGTSPGPPAHLVFETLNGKIIQVGVILGHRGVELANEVTDALMENPDIKLQIHARQRAQIADFSGKNMFGLNRATGLCRHAQQLPMPVVAYVSKFFVIAGRAVSRGGADAHGLAVCETPVQHQPGCNAVAIDAAFFSHGAGVEHQVLDQSPLGVGKQPREVGDERIVGVEGRSGSDSLTSKFGTPDESKIRTLAPGVLQTQVVVAGTA